MEGYVRIGNGEEGDEERKCPHCGQVYEWRPPEGQSWYCEHCGLLEDDEE